MASIKVFFFLATVWTLAQSSPLSYLYFYPIIPHYAINGLDGAWRICPNNTNVHQERYKKVVKVAQDCYREFSQSNQSICHSFELNVQRCSQPLVDFFVECFPEKSKSIPPAVVKAAASMVETFCTSSGEILLEAMNGCIYEFFTQRNKTIRAECRQEFFKSKTDNIKKEFPSLSEICEIGREIGDCWQEYINQDCDSLKARELFSKFYSAALSACNKI